MAYSPENTVIDSYLGVSLRVTVQLPFFFSLTSLFFLCSIKHFIFILSLRCSPSVQFLMFPAVIRSIWPASARLAIRQPLGHFRLHMDPDVSRPIERAIRTKLTDTLRPDHLEVHNESHMHAVPPGSESHFRVLVVSSQFEGLPLIQRHRLVNETLKDELKSYVHALAIQAKTPQQWATNPTLAKSPPCMGGSRGDNTVEEKQKAGRE